MNGVEGGSGLQRDPPRSEQRRVALGYRKNIKEKDKWPPGEEDCEQMRRGKTKTGRSLGARRRKEVDGWAGHGERTVDGS